VIVQPTVTCSAVERCIDNVTSVVEAPAAECHGLPFDTNVTL